MLKALAVRSVLLLAASTVFAAEPSPLVHRLSNPLAAPAPAAYHVRTRELIVSTANGDLRRIADAQTRSPRDAGRVRRITANTILRLRVDSQRDRLWILDIGRVHVFDLATNRVVRTIALPNWLHTDDGSNCIPDLQLDARGAAFVSDNVQPKLWRIDGDDFSMTKRSVALDSRRHIDAGFSALAFGPGGVMFAAIAAGGSLWRVDSGTSRAENIPLTAPIYGACSLETLNALDSRSVTLFVLSAGRESFDVGRIEVSSRSRIAHVDPKAFGPVREPASLVAWSGTLYVASNDTVTPVFRRHQASRALSAVSLVGAFD